MTSDLHVIFGAGQVGTPLAGRLIESGRRVRIVRRGSGGEPAGAELARGDAADPAFCREAARGASVVYHCMNPAYSVRAWRELVPLYLENLVAAAGAAGARLVVLDNLYMLGRPADGRLDEETPMRPRSRKGEVRAAAARQLLEAHQAGRVRALTARASDFYGPGGTNCHLGSQFWSRALAGKGGLLAVDPDAVHTYHYIPDVVAGLVALGEAPDDCYGRAWMLPCRPAEPLRRIIERCAAILGRPLPISTLPRPAMKLLGLFMPMLRELDEMAYQWEGPFIVDDRRFRERFPLRPADLETAARDTVDWARRRFPPPGQARTSPLHP